VTKSAVSNAASIAGMVLTTASTVVEIPQDAPEEAAGHHGHSH
jgi:chaperonin GroEL